MLQFICTFVKMNEHHGKACDSLYYHLAPENLREAISVLDEKEDGYVLATVQKRKEDSEFANLFDGFGVPRGFNPSRGRRASSADIPQAVIIVNGRSAGYTDRTPDYRSVNIIATGNRRLCRGRVNHPIEGAVS